MRLARLVDVELVISSTSRGGCVDISIRPTVSGKRPGSSSLRLKRCCFEGVRPGEVYVYEQRAVLVYTEFHGK